MPEIDRDGVRVHYDVAGDGPPLVLSHGFAATSGMFASNVPALAEQHQVVTWDLRGHGASDYPSDPASYSAPLTVGDLDAILDAAGTERAALGGHSLGGYLSLEFAVTHPDRLTGLVLIDTGPGYRSDDKRAGWNTMAEGYARRLEDSGLASIADSDELRADAHRDTSGLILAARHLLVQHDARVLEGLPSIAVPTLVIVGSEDTAFLGGSEYMAAKIPGARLEVIPGARHAPNVTDPERFNRVVLEFLAALP